MKGEGEKEGFKEKLQQGFAVVGHVFLSWLAGVGCPCKGEWPFERGGRTPFIVLCGIKGCLRRRFFDNDRLSFFQ